MRKSIFIVAMLAALPLSAQQDWKPNLIKSTDALKAGDYATALKLDDRVIDEMIGTLGTGDTAEAAFALVVTHKALALAGLGKEDDAIWYWHEALSIHPGFATADLTPFGAPGEFLKKHLLGEIHLPKANGTGSIQAPVVIKRVNPMWPEGARQFRAAGIIIFESFIDKNGVIRDARIVHGMPAPTLAHAAFEALRQWRFKPGTLNGEPVDVLFNLTMNFKLK